MKKFFVFFLFPFHLFGQINCDPSGSQIAYASNTDGIFIYDLFFHTSKKIGESEGVIIKNSLEFLNDSIVVFGYYGEVTFELRHEVSGKIFSCNPCTESDSFLLRGIGGLHGYDGYNLYSEKFIAINIINQQSWIHKIKNYQLKEYFQETVETQILDSYGNVISVHDTSFTCEASSSSAWEFGCCALPWDYPMSRFYSESKIINGKQVISKAGNLYLKTKDTTILILEQKNEFDFKFGNGYYQPDLALDGNLVVFTYSTEYYSIWGGLGESNLFIMDISKKKVRRISEENYLSPVFAPNQACLLLSKISGEDGTIKEIYLMYIKAKKVIKIGNGTHFAWSH